MMNVTINLHAITNETHSQQTTRSDKKTIRCKCYKAAHSSNNQPLTFQHLNCTRIFAYETISHMIRPLEVKQPQCGQDGNEVDATINRMI